MTSFIPFPALPFLVLGTLIAAAGWLARALSPKSSPVPLLGGLLLAIGIFMIPQASWLCWIGFLLDYGTLCLFRALPEIAWEFWETSPMRLSETYSATDSLGASKRTVTLKLFKAGVFTIRFQFDPPSPDGKLPGVCQLDRSFIGHWRRDGAETNLHDMEGQLLFRMRQSNDGGLAVEQGSLTSPPDPHWLIENLPRVKSRR